MIAMVLPLLALASGCQNCCLLKDSNSPGLFRGNSQTEFASLLKSANQELDRSSATVQQRLAILQSDTNSTTVQQQVVASSNSSYSNDWSNNQNPPKSTSVGYTNTSFAASKPKQDQPPYNSNQPIIRTQSFDYFGFPEKKSKVQQTVTQEPEKKAPNKLIGTESDSSQNVKSAYQYPELSTPDRLHPPGNGLPSPNIGSPNELNPLVQPLERGGNASFPANYADLDIYVAETQTGRINFGGAYNSDNGIVGQFIVDEKNFDITRWPRNFREIMDGTAWRGAGQNFRLELAPGANLERYLVSFTEPHMLGTNYSFSASAYLFQRQYFDWDEKRVGGRLGLGRHLTPDLSISAGLRLERVKLDNERLTTSPQLNSNLGRSDLYLANIGLVRDTRDSQVQATEGSFLSMTFSQAFGDYSFSRGDFDFRRYRLLYERPDGSGRHTISYGTKLGLSGSDTPVFENYFAGGFSTLRGFDFRGAAPVEGGVRVGGEFQWLNTVEYMFPITADDMIKGVLFCDFGTVEEKIEINSENFRVAPGFGFRISMPGAGIGAPLAFDFAFPVSTAAGDEEKVFSFYLGVLR